MKGSLIRAITIGVFLIVAGLGIVVPQMSHELELQRRKIMQCGMVTEIVECHGGHLERCVVRTESCDIVSGVPRSKALELDIGSRVSLVKDNKYSPLYDYHCVNGVCQLAAKCHRWMPCFWVGLDSF